MLHYAGLDERINAGWPAYEAALKANGKTYEVHFYDGANHGFHNDTTPRYDAAAAELAWERTLAFFGRHLATPPDPSGRPEQRQGVQVGPAAIKRVERRPERRLPRPSAAKSVIDERNFSASTTPRIASAGRPACANISPVASLRSRPESPVVEIRRRLCPRPQCIARRHGAVAEPGELRKDEPHPVRALGASASSATTCGQTGSCATTKRSNRRPRRHSLD